MYIRELIKKKGYTQAEIAKKLGQSRVNIANQLDRPSYPTLVKFAEVLEVPIWQLFISPEDVSKELKQESVACGTMGVIYNGKFHEAYSLEQLEAIVSELRQKKDV